MKQKMGENHRNPKKQIEVLDDIEKAYEEAGFKMATMSKKKKIIKIKPTTEYPCQWDALIAPNRKVITTIYTDEEGKKDNLILGINKGKDGIYDIVISAKEINNQVVRNALEDLGKITGYQYKLAATPSLEDRIITYAEKLMKPLKKYGNPDDGYDFSNAQTAKQKAEVVGIWIGEILYEALTSELMT